MPAPPIPAEQPWHLLDPPPGQTVISILLGGDVTPFALDPPLQFPPADVVNPFRPVRVRIGGGSVLILNDAFFDPLW